MAGDWQRVRLNRLETGTGFSGRRIAILYAPEGAPASSLSALRHSLSAAGIGAYPGYTPQGQHVLHVTGFDSDTQLIGLLQQEHAGIDSSGLHVYPLSADCPPQERTLCHRLQHYTGSLTGLCYLAGDAGLLISASRRQLPSAQTLGQHGGNWFRAAAGLNYLVANLMLIGFGNTRRQDAHESVRQAVKALYDTPQERKDAWEAAKGVHQKLHHFLQRYPWEISSAFSLMGSGFQAVSGISNASQAGKQALWETALSLGSLVAVAIPLVVPEKGGHAFLGAGKTRDRQNGTGFLDSLQQWVEEKPLRAAARLSQAANLGHIAFGLHNRDYGYAGAYTNYFIGNSLQGTHSKGQGPGLDELLTYAAEYLAAEPPTAGRAAEIDRLAHQLAAQPEVDYSARLLRDGIAARLASRRSPGAAHMSGYLPQEATALQESPFLTLGERRTLESRATDTSPTTR